MPTDTLPNIVYINFHDTGRHFGCYGQKTVQSPNIDRLAEEGMRFTQAVGVNSLCTPARAALLTGKHSHLNGVKTNGHALVCAFKKRCCDALKGVTCE